MLFTFRYVTLRYVHNSTVRMSCYPLRYAVHVSLRNGTARSQCYGTSVLYALLVTLRHVHNVTVFRNTSVLYTLHVTLCHYSMAGCMPEEWNIYTQSKFVIE